jgi:hypothetical protein
VLRPTQSFGISLFAQPIGASHFFSFADIEIGNHPKSTIIRGFALKQTAKKKAAAEVPRQPWLTQPNRRLDVHLVRECTAPEYVVKGHRSELGMHAAAGETRIMSDNALIESGRMGGGVKRA